jgi:hypothetical protein
MVRFTTSVLSAIQQKNWYSALTLSLTLPDICGKLESPTSKSGERYIAWWNKYLLEKYTIFLSGSDAYALRCAYLHEGGDDVSEQKAQDALTRFIFREPPGNNNIVHCNLHVITHPVITSALQLQVDIFCADICEGVNKWSVDTKDNKDIQKRTEKLLNIAKPAIRPPDRRAASQ